MTTAPTTGAPPIQWGIVAPGRIARKFARDLRVAGGARLRAVASRDIDRARAFAGEFGAELAYDDARALAADPTVDMVYIASPHSAHFEIARNVVGGRQTRALRETPHRQRPPGARTHRVVHVNATFS